MASSGKQKTTWSKLQRESALREKRDAKAARKVARRLAVEEPGPAAEFFTESAEVDDDGPVGQDDSDAAVPSD